MNLDLLLSILIVVPVILGQRSEDLKVLQDITDIRNEVRNFNIDRDYFFQAVAKAIPSIVRSGLSKTTGDVTTVIRFATMLNLARYVNCLKLPF
jgi:hypothetical protein